MGLLEDLKKYKQDKDLEEEKEVFLRLKRPIEIIEQN